MTNKNSVRIRKTVITALCVALCIVLPMAFHMVKNAGTIFLPMHIPVLLCGLICGWQYGLVCGLIGPPALVASDSDAAHGYPAVDDGGARGLRRSDGSYDVCV